MLFKTRFHAGLRDGSIDTTIRRWSRLQVKVGGVYRFDRTADTIVVDAIDKMPVGKLTARDARRSGFADLDELKAALRVKASAVTARTPVYRIRFHYERAAKKAPARPATGAEIETLVMRLARMDRLSKHGPWTRQVLALIDKHSQRRAGDLAPKLDREKPAFKADVRKLKGMGLTKSFEVGYELTPLGKRVLKAM